MVKMVSKGNLPKGRPGMHFWQEPRVILGARSASSPHSSTLSEVHGMHQIGWGNYTGRADDLQRAAARQPSRKSILLPLLYPEPSFLTSVGIAVC